VSDCPGIDRKKGKEVRFAWWEYLPEGWDELAPAIKRLEELLESTWKHEFG
jgi:hypothetical protein